MSTTAAYDVIYHYEQGGKHSGHTDHIRVAAASTDYNTIAAAIKNATQYKSGQGTLVIDNVKNVADSLQQ